MSQKINEDNRGLISDGRAKSMKSKKAGTLQKKHLASSTQLIMNRELEKLAYQRYLARIQKQLSPTEKFFSLIIHRPIIDKISEAISRSIGRPSGILGGGLTALLGSSLLLYMAKHYGFEYNFMAFFVFYAGGCCLGLVTELGLRIMRKN